jgi:putative heme degradation protein
MENHQMSEAENVDAAAPSPDQWAEIVALPMELQVRTILTVLESLCTENKLLRDRITVIEQAGTYVTIHKAAPPRVVN